MSTSPSNSPSTGWLTRFLNRNTALASNSSRRLDRQRANASDLATLSEFSCKVFVLHYILLFQLILCSPAWQLFRRVNYHPENIYNMDEKGFLLGIALKVKVICCRSGENPYYSQDGNRELVSHWMCLCYERGTATMYIYKGSVHLMCWHAGW